MLSLNLVKRLTLTNFCVLKSLHLQVFLEDYSHRTGALVPAPAPRGRSQTTLTRNPRIFNIIRLVDGTIVLPSDGPMFILIDWK